MQPVPPTGHWYEDYERGRPGWPAEVLDVVRLSPPATVLDLGAGTGKLTRLLVPRFSRVICVEPDEAMRDLLSPLCPGADVLAGSAEDIPLAEASVDAVFVAEAFHGFDDECALTEIARVLKPRGLLVLMWNLPAGPTAPSIAAAEQLLIDRAPAGLGHDPVDLNTRRYAFGEWRVAFGDSPFEELQEARFPNPQTVDREGLVAFFESMGWFGNLPASERLPLLAEVRSLLDAPDYRRSWETHVHWTRLADRGTARRSPAFFASQMPTHLEQMSRVYSEETWSVYDLLDRSLEPRGPDSLHELAAEYLVPGAVILDAGCRDAAHLIRLVQAHDATGVGVDPVEIHVARAHAAVAAAGLGARVEIVQGVMEALPYPDRHFDFVWCRDVVEQLDLLLPALQGAARVLKQDGHMLVYTVFVTDLLAPHEFEMLERHMGSVSSNLVEHNVEEAFDRAGLAIERKDAIGTEYKEYVEERTQPASRTLLRIARLRRLRRSVVESHGQDIYNHVEANLHWEVFQFLGKLQPTVYVLRHR